MTAIDIAPRRTRPSQLPSLATRLAMNAASLYRAWRNRRAFYRLSDLSDVELRDIGLSRADLHVAVAAPFGADPTARLRTIVEARNAK